MPANRYAGAGGGLYYLWPPPPAPDGKKYLSVTTMLSSVNKPAIPKWASKRVAEWTNDNWDTVAELRASDVGAAIALMKGAPWRERDEKADLGTAVHEALYYYAQGTPIEHPLDSPIYSHMLQVEDFLRTCHPAIVASEMTVYNDTLGYAGTLDSIMDLSKERWLIDFKTGSGVYPEAAMQLTAYAHGDFVGLARNGQRRELPHIDRAGVLHIRHDGWKLIPVDISEPSWVAFRAARALYIWQQNEGKHCVQEPVAQKDFDLLGTL